VGKDPAAVVVVLYQAIGYLVRLIGGANSASGTELGGEGRRVRQASHLAACARNTGRWLAVVDVPLGAARPRNYRQ